MTDTQSDEIRIAGKNVWYVTWSEGVIDPTAPLVPRSRWQRISEDVRWRIGDAVYDLAVDFGRISDWFDELRYRLSRLSDHIQWGSD